MLIKDNFETMNHSEVINEPLSDASNVRIRVNAEFLRDCAFHCEGCYVQRKNHYTEMDLQILYDAVQKFRNHGFTFDEIILGPTDFFAAYNTEELLAEQKFNRIFKNGDVVLTILTTLQSDDEVILKRIEEINKHFDFPGMEIEVLVVFDLKKVIAQDLDYVDQLKHKINLLNNLNPAVDYALQMNIQDTSVITKEFSLENITTFVREHFDTIVEFNPSFMRTRNPRIMGPVLESWNAMLEENVTPTNKDDVTFTMANYYHAGYNEITYNFKDGKMYMCPFIYENVFDRSEPFLIEPKHPPFYEISDFIDHDFFAKCEQFKYLAKTSECAGCPYMPSCVAKHVIYYMKAYEIKDCMISKKVVELYKR